MSNLQRKAWSNLIVTAVCVAAAGVGVGLAVHLQAARMVTAMSFLIVGSIAFVVSGLRSISEQAKFDERERKIAIRAFIYSSYVFVLLVLLGCFGIFFLAGPAKSVPSYWLPVLFLSGLFFSNVVESAVVLFQFAREMADEQ